MSLLIPAGLLDAPRTKVAMTSTATGGSTSLSAPGTGLVYVPFFAVIIASTAGASYACYNGTGGSQLFKGITAAGAQEFNFWSNPGGMAQNKPLVIETGAGIGQGEFHVYAAVVRGGVGSDGLAQ